MVSRPGDPNFKEPISGVTIEGYGYTEAGLTITYILHYENVGTIVFPNAVPPTRIDTNFVEHGGVDQTAGVGRSGGDAVESKARRPQSRPGR